MVLVLVLVLVSVSVLVLVLVSVLVSVLVLDLVLVLVLLWQPTLGPRSSTHDTRHHTRTPYQHIIPVCATALAADRTMPLLLLQLQNAPSLWGTHPHLPPFLHQLQRPCHHPHFLPPPARVHLPA